MKFWKTTILFSIYKDKPPNSYLLHTPDRITKTQVTQHWREVFSYMGKNGIKKIATEEITKQEWLDYYKNIGYDKPYGIK